MRSTPSISIAVLFLLFALITACGDHVSGPATGNQTTGLVDAPENFDYDSRSSVRVVFRALNNTGAPLDLVRCNVYTSRADRENGENHIMQGFTNTQGTFATEVPVGSVDSVFLKFNYVGSINQAEAPTNIGDLIFILGQGVNGKRGQITSDEPKDRNGFAGKSTDSPSLSYLGTWNANGLPDYLATPVEVTQGELDTVNLFIPQGVSMTREFPQYFSSGVQNNINVLIDTPLYLTFLHQDTGQNNVFCYFTYPTNSPPDSISDIDSLTVIFPHAHFAAGLQVGDRVKLGDFTAGTSVGFAVIRNGWNGEAPTIDGHTFYTFDEFNPEPLVDYQHFILVNDADYNFRSSDDRLLMSCEDNFMINPAWHNYDDLIFYISSDKDAIDKTDIPEPPVAPDCDGDGVPDYRDAFPCDENRALIIEWGWETVAFEDDWPSQGDLDFNDLVVSTKYIITCDWDNLITDIQAQIVPTAHGTSRENGYGFSLPVSPTDVTSTSGYYLTGGYVTLNANGTEAGQDDATFIVFDNIADLMPTAESGFGVNTERGIPYVQPDTITMQILFNTRFTGDQLGWPPYNPFMIVDQTRGREVHLNSYEPTKLVDASLFNTADDSSDVENGRYYRTADNLPWALHIPVVWEYNSSTGWWTQREKAWDHLFEGEALYDGYIYFDEWLRSGGVEYDGIWYKNEDWATDQEKIYYPFGIGKQ